MLHSTLCYLLIVLSLGALSNASAASGLNGSLTDPQDRAVSGATIRILRRADSSRRETKTDDEGRFSFVALDAGEYRLTAEAAGFPVITKTIMVSDDRDQTENLQFSELASQNQSVTISAGVSDSGLYAPDPAERIIVRDETLDANPGRPGMPVSIPGMPVESPAGGIKPPQYFVPGVAGDHGEPIAMFFQVGGFLFQNNLPVNAHGNGYADPNVIIPIAIETVETDGGAFNVREGNNSVNGAIVFGLRDRLEPVIRLTADPHDVNLVGGWSPVDPSNKLWLGLELSYGNGFLGRLEHRRQIKENVSKVFTFGRHDLAVYGIGYYGFAYQPGLIPTDTNVPGDTIDPRQREETSNGAVILNDVWHLTDQSQFQFSAFYRYYTLDVRPNFGDGLIWQSEHRNVNSEDMLYSHSFSEAFSIMAGVDLRREAPRDLDLDRADAAGVFQPVTANNITINFYSPYVAADGTLLRFLHYNIGYRSDEVGMGNQDLMRGPSYSFSRHAVINSPKGTLSLLPPESASLLPAVSLSYGQAFHVNDPRIGTTDIYGGTIVAKARAYQLVTSKTIAATEFRVTLAHVTTSQQLARIDNDTGLQQDVGPGVLRSLTATARRNFTHGFVQGSFARADARDRLTGEPTPEAPRLIWDVLATIEKLPFHLVARGEYESVGRKPLGDGFVAVPVRELRGAILRPFERQGIDVGVNFLWASGYGGQTLETLALPGEGDPFERITGFPLRSYVTASFTYHFRRGMSR
ncbi:MAG TPA: carboxypeptidase-like regulatory domain-containing protein [Bryobacteraceae bacterium]|nr:carboxypeptidase-like regulatory domain-containing protein [Bryobacteraceae bacterium]